MKVGREVERYQSADGKHLLRIFRRDTTFYFTETSEVTEKDETFWTATLESNLHDSLDAARRDAVARVAWLRDVL